MAGERDYLQPETLRTVQSLEGRNSGALKVGPKPAKQGGPEALEAAQYTGPEDRCEACDHFDERGSRCRLHKAAVDPMGHCQDFERYNSEEGETPAQEMNDVPEEYAA